MNEEHIIEQLPAYTLGGLESDGERQVEQHVQTCPRCRAELKAFNETVGALSASVPPVWPPDRVKAAVLARVRSQTAGEPPPQRGGSRLRNWLASTAPVWALTALVLLALLVATNWNRLQGGAPAAAPPAEFALITLTGTDEAPDATGILLISPEGTAGSLVVDGLPSVGPAQQYQLWLIRDGQRTNGGVFSVDEAGYGILAIEAPRPLGEYLNFGITIEPTGGSPGPTGPRVMGGEA